MNTRSTRAGPRADAVLLIRAPPHGEGAGDLIGVSRSLHWSRWWRRTRRKRSPALDCGPDRGRQHGPGDDGGILENSLRLRPLLPDEIVKVSESGMRHVPTSIACAGRLRTPSCGRATDAGADPGGRLRALIGTEAPDGAGQVVRRHRLEDALLAVELGVDALGFNFVRGSPAASFPRRRAPSARPFLLHDQVGVFADERPG